MSHPAFPFPQPDIKPRWAVLVYDGEGKSQLGLYQPVNGPVTLEGNPAFLGDLVAALGSVRFFQSPGPPAPHELN